MANIVTTGTKLEQVVNLLGIKTRLVVDIAVGATNCNDSCPKLSSLLCSAPSHVAKTRECHRLALDVESMCLHHLVDKIEGAVACCFWTKDASAPLEAFTGEGCSMELSSELLVHAEKVTNLSAAYADVACRYVHIRADVPEQLHHKGLTEAHNLCVALASRREVRAAFTAAHWQCRKCILECLLEAKELQDA